MRKARIEHTTKQSLFRLSALAVLGIAAVPANPDSGPRRVLLINSYHQGYEWTDSIVRGIRETLQRSHVPIDLDIEYLDQRRRGDRENVEAAAQYYKRKFARTQLDAIIASDDPAVRFILKRRVELFGDVPVVFCGVNEYHGSSAYVSRDPKTHPWLAGVLETVDFDSTVSIALQLQPATRTLVPVGESEDSPDDRNFEHAFPQLKLQRIVTTHLSLDELGRQLAALQPKTVVVVGAFSRDRTGRTLSVEEGTRFVCDHSAVPVYGLIRNVLGFGVVGGKLTDGYQQGRLAATMALEMLKGASPASLGIRESPNIYGFDYLQLTRWGLPISALPKQSLIINRPRSFYAIHPVWVWGAAFFVFAQMVAILLLLVQRRQRRKAERSLALYAEKLERSNYMLNQFAYVTAHDFQEPIRNVAIFTELLGRTYADRLSSEERQVMEFALSGARKTHAMLRGLMDWVTAVDEPFEAGALTDSREQLNKVLEARATTLDQADALVSIDPLPSIHMSGLHLFRIWDSLLANALEYHGTEPIRINISAERLEGQWKFCVADNGLGIPAAFQERIFSVFKRLHQTAESRTGMGLAICRRIVDHYGGRLWVESREGHGSKFCFTIPDDGASEAGTKGQK
jgi:signal transduction histidine kinase